jgi:hypothetical protein
MGTALGVALGSALYATAAGASGARTLHTAAVGLTVALTVLGCVALATGLALLLNGHRTPTAPAATH